MFLKSQIPNRVIQPFLLTYLCLSIRDLSFYVNRPTFDDHDQDALVYYVYRYIQQLIKLSWLHTYPHRLPNDYLHRNLLRHFDVYYGNEHNTNVRQIHVTWQSSRWLMKLRKNLYRDKFHSINLEQLQKVYEHLRHCSKSGAIPKLNEGDHRDE